MGHSNKEQATKLQLLLQARDRALRAEIHDELLRSGEERYKDIAGLVSDSADEAVADMLTA